MSQETCLGEHLQLLFVEGVVRKCSRAPPGGPDTPSPHDRGG